MLPIDRTSMWLGLKGQYLRFPIPLFFRTYVSRYLFSPVPRYCQISVFQDLCFPWRTKEEVGRQHQGMDRPGVRQVPDGSGEQGKMEKTGCKNICCAPTTLAVKGLMMMMLFLLT